MRKRHVNRGLPGSTIFPILLHKEQDFRKKKNVIKKEKYVWFSLQLLSEKFLILRTTDRDTIKNV